MQPQPILLEKLTANEQTSALVQVDTTVENVKVNAGFTLPLTGGIGLWLIIGIGTLIVVLSLARRARAES